MKEINFNLEDLKKQSYLTMTESCFIARQDRKEVLAWIKSGRIKAYQPSENGKYKINAKSLLKYLENLEDQCRFS